MAAEQEAEETVSQELHSVSEPRIVLLGGGRAGKSAAGNTILGREEFRSGIRHSAITEECEMRTGEVAGRRVTVVDTPSLLDTDRVKIERCVSLSAPGPHAFLLVISVYSKEIIDTHSESIVEHYCKSFDKVQELFGERAVRNTMILFTFGDRLEGRTTKQHIEEAGEEFQQLVEKCGNRYHVLNNEDRSDHTQVIQLLDKIDNMVKVTGGCYLPISSEIYQEVEERIRLNEQELDEKRKEELSRKEEELNHKYKEQERKTEEMKQKLEEERLGKAEEVKQRYEAQRVKAEQQKQQYEEEQLKNTLEIKQMYEEQCGKIPELLQKHAEQLPRELQELKKKLDEEQHSKGDVLKQKYEERVCREIEELPFKKEEPKQNYEEKIKEIKQWYEEKLHRKIEELKREYEQLYIRKEEELKQKHQEELLRKEQELKQQYEEEYSEKEQQLKQRYEEQCRGVEEMKLRLEEEQQRKLEEVIQNYEKQHQGVEEMKQRYKEEQQREVEELKQKYEEEQCRREDELMEKSRKKMKEEELEKEPAESKLPVRRRHSIGNTPPNMCESKVEIESEESKLPVRRRNSKECDLPYRQGIMAAEHKAEETVSPELNSPSELRMVLLAGNSYWKSGKSATGNTILGREEFRSAFSFSAVTKECEKRTGEVNGRRVTVVDTPDLLDTDWVKIERCVSLSSPGPHAFLLVTPVYLKESGHTQWWKSVGNGHCKSLDKVKQLFGEGAVRNTMILFTCGDYLKGKTIEDYIQTGSKELQQLVEKCGNRYHVLNNRNRTDRTQVTQLLDKIDNMEKGNGGCYYTSEMDQEGKQKVREMMGNEKNKLLKEIPGELELQLELRREVEIQSAGEGAQEGEQELKKDREKRRELEEEEEREKEKEIAGGGAEERERERRETIGS